ncbi:MAG TPA: thiamine pyrophosphate-dependent enzyme [Acetobacteraceae bacterium]|nr:thiamine pyrophosphate-dependent enzyme [Acetobacteraceae bacterium]
MLDLFGKGKLSGTTHTCLGQEFCQMAVVRALQHEDDAVLSNHRNHGHFLTYSGDFTGLVAEVMGRQDGVCGGRGGSQHMAWRHFHSNGVQAGMTGIAVGLARAREMSASPGIVAVIVGDGTLGEGLLYESMNLAAVWPAPVLFVVEHNGIAQTTDTADTIGGDILARGAAFGLSTYRVSDADPELWHVAETAVADVRRTRRPAFLVIDTARLGPHSKGDDLRPEADIAAIRARDPVARLGATLDPAERDRLDAAVGELVNRVANAAAASPEAHELVAVDTVFRHAPQLPAVDPSAASSGQTVRAALNATLDALLTEDPRTILLGEDLHDPYGGAFKVTAGLSQRYPGRVVSTPISEGGITGAAIGLALAGKRPIMEVMFGDFLTLCADQIYNHAVKFPGLFPELSVPMVIRTPVGGRRGYGPTHSQSPENIFTAIPGLTVLYGSQRHDNGALLRNAVLHWPFPTLFLEHKLVYGATEDPGAYHPLPAHPADIGGAAFPTLQRRSLQADAVLLTYGGMVPLVEAVADQLAAEEELELDIIILAQLAPLPRHALLAALTAYDAIVIAEETHTGYGVGAEIIASLAEAGYRGSIRRVGTPPVPIPSARSLELAVLPDADCLAAAVLDAIEA